MYQWLRRTPPHWYDEIRMWTCTRSRSRGWASSGWRGHDRQSGVVTGSFKRCTVSRTSRNLSQRSGFHNIFETLIWQVLKQFFYWILGGKNYTESTLKDWSQIKLSFWSLSFVVSVFLSFCHSDQMSEGSWVSRFCQILANKKLIAGKSKNSFKFVILIKIG